MLEHESERRPSVGLGITVGLVMAALTCVAAVIIYALRGPEAFTANGTTLPRAVVTYLAAGVLGGGVGGLLFPLTARSGGGAIVGALAAVPLYLSIALQLQAGLLIGTLGGIVVGGVVGHRLFPPPPTASPGSSHPKEGGM